MSDAASEHDGLRKRLAATLRDVPDFPKPGVAFKDITPVLADAALLRDVISALATPWEESGVTHVAGVESRGFILAAPVAIALGAGFIPIRKPGKLPWKTAGKEYALEYGTDRLEMHVDACPAPARVLLVDDVLATGGTAAAACELIEQVNGTVLGCAFLLSIAGLNGAHRLSLRRVVTLLEC
ncbi:MAG: Adenine phosphoribosyltransferase [Gemmatimonadetes bacterium]|nr:Adenine phosphoribosyltransferase [Gemmatimonadota bacterium]